MKQEDFLPIPLEERKLPAKKYLCKEHKWIQEYDLIDVTRKGNIIKRCRFCEKTKMENRIIFKEEWNREKENLTDYYLSKVLSGGRNSLKMRDIPKELIELKRASIKLNRKVKELKEPLKECSHHGKLYRNDVIKAGKNKSGTQAYKCKKCMREQHAKNYQLNKRIILSKNSEYRKNNHKKIRELKAEQRKRERADILKNQKEKERKAYRGKIDVENLTDSYIKRKLAYRTVLTSKDIPQELIELKRSILLLKRNVKKKRDEEILNLMENDNVK